jgi:hypothetical protein
MPLALEARNELELPFVRTRVVSALALLFAPIYLLPFPYPYGEVARFALLLLLFPSAWTGVAVVPFVLSTWWGDDYFLFNQFSVVAVVGCAVGFASFLRRLGGAELQAVLRDVLLIMVVASLVAAMQVVLPGLIPLPSIEGRDWGNVDGRAIVGVSEPSFLAGPLGLVLSLSILVFVSVGVMRRRVLMVACLVSAVVIASQSLLVVVVVLPLLVVLFFLYSFFGAVVLVSALAAGTVPWLLLRVSSAEDFGGGASLGDVAMGLASWRNIPDEAILLEWERYLLPILSGSREHLSESVFRAYPEHPWIEHTYSVFSAASLTAGLVVVAGALVYGIVLMFRNFVWHRQLWVSSVFLYVLGCASFLIVKVDPSLAMGLACLYVTGRRIGVVPVEFARR